MKKLTKKKLDDLVKTLSVISDSEMDAYWGMYYNDCFWRCVAYMNSGGSNYSETAAASLANNFFSSQFGQYTSAYLTSLGAGMTISQIQSYIAGLVSSNSYSHSQGAYIGVFNTNDVSFYEGGDFHAAIILNQNSDGSLNVFDPQLQTYFTMSSSESSHISRVF